MGELNHERDGTTGPSSVELRGFHPSAFDPSYPIGKDFYRYVNARWLSANPIPAEYGSWGAFHEVHVRNEELLHELMDHAAMAPGVPATAERMVGDYWAAGMDESAIEAAGLEPLVEHFDTIDSLESSGDLGNILSSLRRAGIGMIFGSHVSPDFEDADRYLLYVAQGGLGLPERDYYFREDEHSETLRADYETHIARMLALVGRDNDPAAAARAIVELETQLATHSFTPTELRDTERITNKIAREDYGAAMPAFDLTTYLSDVAGSAPPAINLDNPGFFTVLGELMSGLPVATLRSYLRWNLIRATASALSSAFVAESFDFYGRRIGGQRELKPRWKRVLAAASADIGQQVSKLYVAAAFSPEAKRRCEEMVEHLLAAMGESIRGLEWMSDTTKQKALAKLAGFSYKIGYPDKWRDYSALRVDRRSFVVNRLRAAAFEYQRKISKLNEPVDKDEWAMEPHAVNAYYHPLYNEVVFPAGILQPPFFRADADNATNFGAIGTVIGHEITHGFDDQGSKFDATGKLQNWWHEDDRVAFDRLAAGLAEQYSKYEPLREFPVNGELTLGENIADLGGVTLAFHALQAAAAATGRSLDEVGEDGLTAAQRFFVSYATIWRGNYTDEYLRLIVTSDPHAPNEYRCNGVLENFPPFATAFDLDPSSPLAKPAGDHIKIW